MAPWRDDSELFTLMRQKLFTAVVGDILDEMGMRKQFLPQNIRPLDAGMLIAGRAMTVQEEDLPVRPVEGSPFGVMLEALDDLKTNEVYLASGGSPVYAMWGELMSTRAMRLGAAGAVVNGCSRDTKAILALGFSTFSTGPYAQDQRSRGHVVDYRVPLQVGQVRVAPGDIIFGDLDGVLVIPRAAEREALIRSLEKVAKEDVVRNAIERDGMSTVAAFAKFGVM